MGGFFGVVANSDCVNDVFFGTDYHSHLGTRRGGMAVCNGDGVKRFIHDISNSQFRSKLEPDLQRLSGHMGIGVISDYEDQPLLIGSHLGTYAIVTVGRITNIEELTREAYKNATHFSEMSGDETNPTELVATLIGQEKTFEDGLLNVQEKIKGSCSILLLTDHGIYAARDRFGRTPVILGENKATGAVAVTMETAAFPNLDYEVLRELGPGEVVLINHDGIEQKCEPRKDMKICTFLWVYYGYPASMYEGHNVEQVRYRCGAKLAQADDVDADIVAGIPDSGTAHAIGYANHARIPYERPFVKYTPTWPRSFMPQDQSIRDLVARMKLIPVRSLIADKRLVFCEDSIVRGTQLRDIIQRVYDYGAKEIHMRPACPPLLFGCPYLNFSRSKSELDLAARRAVKELEGADDKNLDEYSDPSCDKHCAMIERIRGRMNLTTLRYQTLDDLLDAIGIPKENLCTYCWNGCK